MIFFCLITIKFCLVDTTKPLQQPDLVALEEALKGDLTDEQKAELHFKLGSLLLQQRDATEARDHLELALSLFPPSRIEARTSAEITLSSCELLLANGERALALSRSAYDTRLKEFGDKHPLVARALIAWGKALAHEGDESALEKFIAAREILSDVTPIPRAELAQLYSVTAAYFMKIDQAESAVQALQVGLDYADDSEPLAIQMKLQLSEAHMANSDTMYAEPILREVSQAPNATELQKAMAAFGLANIYKLWHNDEIALSMFDTAFVAFSSMENRRFTIACLIHQAQILRANGRMQEALLKEAKIMNVGGREDDVVTSREAPIRLEDVRSADPINQ